MEARNLFDSSGGQIPGVGLWLSITSRSPVLSSSAVLSACRRITPPSDGQDKAPRAGCGLIRKF